MKPEIRAIWSCTLSFMVQCAIDGIFVYNGVRLRVLTPKLGKERKVPMYKMLKS